MTTFRRSGSAGNRLPNVPRIQQITNRGKMKTIFLVLACAFVANAELYGKENEDEESFRVNKNKNIYLEIPAIGNGFALLFPSRVFSIKADISDNFGVVLEPVVGYNIIKGVGSTVGFYYRDGINQNGLKYVFIDVSRYGALNEIYYDYDRYLRTAPGLNLRYGLSAGIGMSKFSENKNETRASIDYGPTFRLHLDISYLIKYN
jgi:hypothetical protein